MKNKIGKFKITTYPPSFEQIENGAIFVVEAKQINITSFLSSLKKKYSRYDDSFIIDRSWLEKNRDNTPSIINNLFTTSGEQPIIFNTEGCPDDYIGHFLSTYDLANTRKILIAVKSKNRKIIFSPKHKQAFVIAAEKLGPYIDFERKNCNRDTKIQKNHRDVLNVMARVIFLCSTTIAFALFSLFGSSLQITRMSSTLESMTYFMSKQPEYSRIHAVYMEEYDIEQIGEAEDQSTYYSYQQMQNIGSRYQYNNYIETYLLSGKANQPIQYEATLDGYDNYNFETKIIGLSAYSNQNRILMETIRLEQYLITKNPFFSPLNGAESVYYMPSHIADILVEQNVEDDIENYSDLIGKTMTLTHNFGSSSFSIVVSINNIFYTTYNDKNLGTPINIDDEVHNYDLVDKGFGSYLTNTIGNFGVSSMGRAHQTFGTTFCFDFEGRNKLLTRMIDEVFGSDYANDGSYIDFFYNGKPTAEYELDLHSINDIYREPNNALFGANYLHLSLSLFFVLPSLISYIFLFRKGKPAFLFNDDSYRRMVLDFCFLTSPLFLIQMIFLFLVLVLGHSTFSISLLNVVGSGFSLLFTAVLYISWNYRKRKSKITERLFNTYEIFI